MADGEGGGRLCGLAGRRLFVISPELHECLTRKARRWRWVDFKQWGVDGVCTDYALEAGDFFGR